jgi:3-deoxy-D-manno-octulosonate 8-phosphate phosphatase (KDO 8-P phosphatase)
MHDLRDVSDETDHIALLALPIRLAVFDFDGVFTSNCVYVFEDGREAVRCSRFDGLGLRRLERAGVEPVVLSTEQNPVVAARCAKLKIACQQGCDDKRGALEKMVSERGLDYSQVAFTGNDINDLLCLQSVGFPIVVQDAHPDVVALGRYRTMRSGGHGAVREVCDLIAAAIETSANAQV